MSTHVPAVHLRVWNYAVHTCGTRLTAYMYTHMYYHVCACGMGIGLCVYGVHICPCVCCVCLRPLLMSVYIHVQVPFRVSKPVLTHVGLEIAVCALPLPRRRHAPQPHLLPRRWGARRWVEGQGPLSRQTRCQGA